VIITVSISVYGKCGAGKSTLIRDVSAYIEKHYDMIMAQQTFSKNGEHWRCKIKQRKINATS